LRLFIVKKNGSSKSWKMFVSNLKNCWKKRHKPSEMKRLYETCRLGEQVILRNIKS